MKPVDYQQLREIFLGAREGEEREAWLLEAGSPDQILDRIQREFVLGGHKAAAMASVMKRARIYLVSGLPAALVRDCGLLPFADLGTAIDAALHEIGSTASVIALPYGGSVMPLVTQDGGMQCK